MKSAELNAVVETLENKIEERVILSGSCVGLMEFKGVMQENFMPPGFMVSMPKVGKYEKELALVGLANGKQCIIPLNLPNNQEVVRKLGLLIFAIETESYEEFVSLALEVSSELLSVYAEGDDLYMSERIPGWGKYKVKESSK